MAGRKVKDEAKVNRKRIIRLYAGLTLSEQALLVESEGFSEAYIKLQTLRNDHGRQELAIQKQIHQIVSDRMDKRISAGEAQRLLSELIPSEEARRKAVNDYLRFVLNAAGTDEEQARRAHSAFRQSKRLFSANRDVRRGFVKLATAARQGDAAAIQSLVEFATDALLHLLMIDRLHPEKLRALARERMVWPILTDGNPGWERRAAETINQLQLGAGLTVFRAQFRRTRGAVENYPVRKWGMKAVRAIEETKLRFVLLGEYDKELRLLVFEQDWEIEQAPSWVDKVARLPAFSADSIPEWAKVIREMIREQLPDFHLHADWKTQRNTARLNGRDKVGEIQNAILDDICSALKSFAPVCRN